MTSEQKIFDELKKDFEKTQDFDSYLSQNISFDGRNWTAGQFLYKHFFDQAKNFYLKAQSGTYEQDDSPMVEKLKTLRTEGLLNIPKSYEMFQKGIMPDTDMFDGNREKENFYRELFGGRSRSTEDNPCYWHPASQYYTRFIEHRLSQMGMSEKQIRDLMVHCEHEREKTEQEAILNMPSKFIHNSPHAPGEMVGDTIKVRARPDDNFLNFQKYVFFAKPDTFHSGLPIQGQNIDDALWPRFSPQVMAFCTDAETLKPLIRDTYNYSLDMRQRDAFRPVVPLWGGSPKEWVSVEDVHYDPRVEKETLRDLMAQGKEFYIVPNKDDWRNFIAGHDNMSAEEARKYMSDLAKKYPDKVMKLGPKFLAEYEQFNSQKKTELTTTRDQSEKRNSKLKKQNVFLGKLNEIVTLPPANPIVEAIKSYGRKSTFDLAKIYGKNGER